MKAAGRVSHLRLGPDIIMGCVDIIEKANAYYPGMSLDMAIRLALAGLIDAAKKDGTIPTRDGFEYSKMISKYEMAKQGRKLAVSSAVRAEESLRRGSDITKAIVQISKPAEGRDVSEDFDAIVFKKGRVLAQILELKEKREIDPDNYGDAEFKRMIALESELQILEMKLQ